ncbi:DUF1538 domain-containing protein [Desulfocurvibacter africanus]|uniref:DUF1538 domain-containing protein n=1 Tax=Desulfocurvibacter africanus TaxID=873 RepID=UPI002FD9B3A5
MKELLKHLPEVASAILPITGIVLFLHAFVAPMDGESLARFLGGALFVSVGLLLFLQGVKTGLLPMGETVGAELPRFGSVALILGAALILGIVVTMAEPDVRVLAHQVGIVSSGAIGSGKLVLVVSLGVGACVCAAVLRIILGVPIAWFFAIGYLLIIALSFVTPDQFVPVAFDAGGVTTGPVTVPFILALGIGIASVLGGRSAISDGFGLIGIASIGPVIGIMILGLVSG